jgi:hypothetical protein
MFAILHSLAMFVIDFFKSPRRLEAENLFLRHQLSIALRRAPPRPRLVPTLTFERLFAFLVLGHGRRQLLWFEVTRHPTAEWLARQITEAFPSRLLGAGQRPCLRTCLQVAGASHGRPRPTDPACRLIMQRPDYPNKA